jgi:nitroreductase
LTNVLISNRQISMTGGRVSIGDRPDIADLIRSRRTIHHFKPEPPPESTLLDAIEAARWAPNHRVTEPWQFYLLGSEAAAKISQLNYEIVLEDRGEAAAQNKLQRWLSMPAWFVVTCARSESELRQKEDYAACCCAIQNLFLYLWSAGLGAKWGTGSVTRHPDFYKAIGADPETEEVVGMFWYGYPAVIPGGQRQRSVDQIVTRRD